MDLYCFDLTLLDMISRSTIADLTLHDFALIGHSPTFHEDGINKDAHAIVVSYDFDKVDYRRPSEIHPPLSFLNPLFVVLPWLILCCHELIDALVFLLILQLIVTDLLCLLGMDCFESLLNSDKVYDSDLLVKWKSIMRT